MGVYGGCHGLGSGLTPPAAELIEMDTVCFAKLAFLGGFFMHCCSHICTFYAPCLTHPVSHESRVFGTALHWLAVDVLQ